jgi:hypothetical protein
MKSDHNLAAADAKPDEASEIHEIHRHIPVTGVGIAGAGVAGAIIGGAVAGPIGAVVGAIIGTVAGRTEARSAAPEDGESKRYEPLMVPPTDEEIANRAWKYFEAKGNTDGHDFDDWVRAESDLYKEALAARDRV